MKNRYGLEPVYKEVARAEVDSTVTCWGCGGSGHAPYGKCYACDGTGVKHVKGEWVITVDVSKPEPFSIAEFYEEEGTI